MSWCESMCECGDTVSYGFYSSEHEDELTEINITVLCGQCVRERDGIPSEEDSSGRYEDFKNIVLEHGFRESINFNDVQEHLHEVLLINVDFFNKTKDEMYIKAGFGLLSIMPPTAIRWQV